MDRNLNPLERSKTIAKDTLRAPVCCDKCRGLNGRHEIFCMKLYRYSHKIHDPNQMSFFFDYSQRISLK